MMSTPTCWPLKHKEILVLSQVSYYLKIPYLSLKLLISQIVTHDVIKKFAS